MNTGSTPIGVRSRARACRWGQGPSELITLPVVFLVGALVCLARSPADILHPELWAEDGPIWFADAYQHGWLWPLGQPHAGYLQTFPRLIADIGLEVPLRRLPLLFVGVSVVVQVLPAVVVASRRFSVAVPSFAVRLTLAVVYLVAPNTSEINANLTNAQWHLALLAVLAVLATEARGSWRVFDVTVLALSGLTGPFGLVLIPVIVAMYMYRRHRWTLVLLVIALITSIAQVVFFLTSPRGKVGPLGVTAQRLIEILGGQIVGGATLGTSTLISIEQGNHAVAYAVLLLLPGALLVGLVLWRGPVELKLFNVFAAFVLTASLLSPVASATGSQWQALTQDYGARYWLFPTLAILSDLVWLAGQVRIWRAVPAVVGVLALSGVALFGIRTDFSQPVLPKPDWAAQVEQFNTVPRGSPYTFMINPTGVTMTLVKK